MVPGLALRARRIDAEVDANSPDCDAAADGAVQHLRGLLDASGGGVERVGHRNLGRTGAIGCLVADTAQALDLLLQFAHLLADIKQLIADGERSHHGEPGIADLAELAAQIGDARFQSLCELEKPELLALLAGHAVLPAVDGDVDVAHSSASSSSASSSSSSSSSESSSSASSASASSSS